MVSREKSNLSIEKTQHGAKIMRRFSQISRTKNVSRRYQWKRTWQKSYLSGRTSQACLSYDWLHLTFTIRLQEQPGSNCGSDRRVNRLWTPSRKLQWLQLNDGNHCNTRGRREDGPLLNSFSRRRSSSGLSDCAIIIPFDYRSEKLFSNGPSFIPPCVLSWLAVQVERSIENWPGLPWQHACMHHFAIIALESFSSSSWRYQRSWRATRTSKCTDQFNS